MKIRKTKSEELEVLLKMYEHARRFMATHGNASQWENNYPFSTVNFDDITEGTVMSAQKKDRIVATFIIKKGLIRLACASTKVNGSTTPVTELFTASLPPEM